ncbi:hypothetical protein PFICI_12459 [Pestalotiopsis fici W106-1]|uniref:Uncharacterized protein n=1 Tax=Pestalotiopsis fici (strain W106-1 / CGMCC3.15140) TaxID=1229662 RepID=W3WNM1_PESFW|nr:uncharacterized protein PFICI_12459 [Pestalotiopsis fici W106-1]ETS75515.1 hypothetical protein PFICI_12459 [Pestalotiopsis fici W106-1]
MTVPASGHQMHQTSDSQAEGPLQEISACRCQAHESHEYTTLFKGRLPRLGAESGAFHRPSPDFAQWIAISIAGVLTVVLAVGIYVIARFYNVSLDGSRGPDRKRRAPKSTGNQTGMDCYLNDDSAVNGERKMRRPNFEDHRTMAKLEASSAMSKSGYHDPSQKTVPGTSTMEHETWRQSKRVHIRKSMAKEEEAFGKSLSPRIANRESRSAKGLNFGTAGEELRQRHFDTTAS